MPTAPTPALVDPERQFLGALMQMPLPGARRVLADVRPDDLAHPPGQWVLALACDVVAAGLDPSPMALLDRARETTDTSARSGGADQLAQLGVWLVDTYRDATGGGEDYARWLTTVLLRQAWRRAVAEHATRLLQAVEQAPTGELYRIATDTRRLDQLWSRYQHATGHPPVTAALGNEPARKVAA
ncbi:hypothetical protein [Pseudonocardia acaciae]|uniref:hypothetical protein n=1 Tax=Pseudonocardia acaciae TaxID=551276 RepID=UPI0007E8D49F|nr:hypothetical protein [Pseudonocardia acaciae]